MKRLEKAWAFLSGKKAVIGGAIANILIGCQMVDLALPPTVYKILALTGFILGGGGLAHKAGKKWLGVK